MLSRVRELIGDGEAVELIEADVRDLGAVRGPFDFILFSFNGIDAVGPEDRLRIFAEVRRLLRPSGRFQFSSHSIGALPLSLRRERPARWSGSRLYSAYARLADFRNLRHVRRINARIDLDAARERGWVIVPERGHMQIDDYYVDPAYQVRQLREAGFGVEAILDRSGREVTLPHAGRDPWLDYLCVPLPPG
ncbi:MAG: methyltransferase domain-containing protein [Solirubrobacterales bacterium]